ncbi:MAG: SOS response-associated peptidase [Betaproteobacteria bacterium]
MCGRYALHASPEVVALQFGLASVPAFTPRYNIAPTAQIMVVQDSGPAMVRWGLVPRWAKDPSIGVRMNNARAETVAEKPSFREAFRKRRCLIPASGFYEWKLEGKLKQPYYVRPAAGELFAFAGLWERWEGPGGPLQTCAVITTEANTAMAPIHDRMPVILDPAHYQAWLAGSAPLQPLLIPCTPAAISVYRVSRAVNDARRDNPGLVDAEGTM